MHLTLFAIPEHYLSIGITPRSNTARNCTEHSVQVPSRERFSITQKEEGPNCRIDLIPGSAIRLKTSNRTEVTSICRHRDPSVGALLVFLYTKVNGAVSQRDMQIQSPQASSRQFPQGTRLHAARQKNARVTATGAAQRQR